MAILKLILRYALTFPGDLCFAWPLAIALRLLWGASIEWRSGAALVVLAPTSWPMRSWFKRWGGWTFGHGIMLAPNQADSVFHHELVHVEQIEGAAAWGFALFVLLSALGWWYVGLLLWPLAPALAYGGAALAAWLRSEPNAYVGNVMEEGARAIAGTGCDTAPPT